MTSRPAIVRLDESVDHGQARVILTLAWGDDVFAGEAIGSPETDHRPRLVGEATLRAVEAVTQGSVHMELMAIATTSMGPARVAMAQVKLRESGRLLVGNAVVDEDDPSLAAVKAVLDAINRPLGTVL